MVTRKERLQKQQKQARQDKVEGADLQIQQEALREGKTVERIKREKEIKKINKQIKEERKKEAKKAEKQLKKISTLERARKYYKNIPEQIKKYVKTTPEDLEKQVDSTIERLKKKVKEAEKDRDKWEENEDEAEEDWREDRAEERVERYEGQIKGYNEMINRLKEGKIISYSDARGYARDVGDREEAEEEARNERRRARQKAIEEAEKRFEEDVEEQVEDYIEGSTQEQIEEFKQREGEDWRKELREAAELKTELDIREDFSKELTKEGLRSDVAAKLSAQDWEKLYGLEQGKFDIAKRYKKLGTEMGYEIEYTDEGQFKLKEPKKPKKEEKDVIRKTTEEPKFVVSGEPVTGEPYDPTFIDKLSSTAVKTYEGGKDVGGKTLSIASDIFGFIPEQFVQASREVFETTFEEGETEEGQIGVRPQFGTRTDMGKVVEFTPEEEELFGVQEDLFDPVRQRKREEETMEKIEEGTLDIEFVTEPEQVIETELEALEREMTAEAGEFQPNTEQFAALASRKVRLQKNLAARERTEEIQTQLQQDIEDKREEIKDKVREGELSQIEAEEQFEEYVDKRVGTGEKRLEREIKEISEGTDEEIAEDIEISKEQLEEVRETEKWVTTFTGLPGVAASAALYAAGGAAAVSGLGAVGGAIGGSTGGTIGAGVGYSIAVGEDVLDVYEIAPYAYEQYQEGDTSELSRIGINVGVGLVAGTLTGKGIAGARGAKLEAEIQQAPITTDVVGKGVEAFKGLEVPKGTELQFKGLLDKGFGVRRVQADIADLPKSAGLQSKATADFVEVLNRQGEAINRISVGEIEAKFRGRTSTLDIIEEGKGMIDPGTGKIESVFRRIEGRMGDDFYPIREVRGTQETNIQKLYSEGDIQQLMADTETSEIARSTYTAGDTQKAFIDAWTGGREIDMDTFSRTISQDLSDFEGGREATIRRAKAEAGTSDTRTETFITKELESARAGAYGEMVDIGAVDISLPKQVSGTAKFRTVSSGITEGIDTVRPTTTRGTTDTGDIDLGAGDTGESIIQRLLGDTDTDTQQITTQDTDVTPTADVSTSLRNLARQTAQTTGTDVARSTFGALPGQEQILRDRRSTVTQTDRRLDQAIGMESLTIDMTALQTDTTTTTDITTMDTTMETTMDTSTDIETDVATETETELETDLQTDLDTDLDTDIATDFDITTPELELEFEFDAPDETKRRPTKKKRRKGYNVYAKSKGKYRRVNKYPLPKDKAQDMGSKVVDNTLSANFKIKKAGKKASKKSSVNVDPFYWETRGYKFRDYRISKGKRKRMDNKWIEKKNFRLDTPREVDQISVARFMKQERSKKKRQKETDKRMNKIAGMSNMFSGSSNFGFSNNKKSKNNVDKIAGSTNMFKGKKNPFV